MRGTRQRQVSVPMTLLDDGFLCAHVFRLPVEHTPASDSSRLGKPRVFNNTECVPSSPTSV